MGFLNSLKGLLGGKEPSVIGIDIGMSSVKVVQIKKKKGRAVLETYGELALGPYAGIEIGRAAQLEPANVIGALKDIMREAKVTTRDCGIAIPLSSSFITMIHLNGVDERNLATIIPIEARKYVPLPITEVLLDWWVIPSEDTVPDAYGTVDSTGATNDPNSQNANKNGQQNMSSIDVLIVAIHNEALNKFGSISAGVGLQTSFFEIELFSTIRAALVPGIQSQVIIDIGAATTKLFIIDKGVLKVSHTISRGSQDITLAIAKSMNVPISEAESIKRKFGLGGGEAYPQLSDIITLTLDYIFYEANRVIINYEKKFNKPIGKIVFSGGGSLLKGLSELAQNNFQTEISLADPFQKMETPAFLKEVLREAGPEFTVAIGVALRKISEIRS